MSSFVIKAVLRSGGTSAYYRTSEGKWVTSMRMSRAQKFSSREAAQAVVDDVQGSLKERDVIVVEVAQ